MYRILSESPKFYRRCYKKHFGLFFRTHCSSTAQITVTMSCGQSATREKCFQLPFELSTARSCRSWPKCLMHVSVSNTPVQCTVT